MNFTREREYMIKRKLLAASLVATMMISIVGCGGQDAKEKTTKNNDEQTSIMEEITSDEVTDIETTSETESVEETETTEVTTESGEETTTLVQDTTAETTTEKKSSQEKTTKKPSTTKQPTTTKKEQTTTKDPNHSSNVNEKLKWTNAGWASELKHTASGDYVYVTNKKQTIDPVKGNAFSITTNSFSISEWDAMSLDSYIKGNPGTIRWTSEDPSVAQVINNELVGIYAGTTKISGTCGNTTVQITVTVNRGWKSYDVTLNSNLVNLFPGESFQLIASERNVKYASSNSSVVSVSADGKLTGVAAGTATVTATHNGKKSECKVIVANNDGTYMNVSTDAKYTVTRERVLLASDRTFVILDAGVVIEDNLLENIETILTKIEKVTGYSFTNKKLNDYFATDRVIIAVSGYGSASGGSYGVTIAPYDITIQECGAHVLVHELLHTVQHRNTVYCGNALTEGFAEYFGIQIYTDLPFSRNTYDEEYNSWMNLEYSFSNVTFTADNMKQYLTNPPDSHPTSYFFVKYLVQTYGKDKIFKIQEAITNEFASRFGMANGGGINEKFTEADMFAIVESMTSKNVSKDFYTYFSGLKKKTMASDVDLTKQTGVFNQTFTGHATGSYYQLEGGFLNVNGPLVIEFAHAMDYAKKIYGRRSKGLNVSARIQTETEIISDVPVIYYDAAGNELAVPDDFDFNEGAMKCTRVKVDMQTAGVFRLFVNLYYTFDNFN